MTFEDPLFDSIFRFIGSKNDHRIGSRWQNNSQGRGQSRADPHRMLARIVVLAVSLLLIAESGAESTRRRAMRRCPPDAKKIHLHFIHTPFSGGRSLFHTLEKEVRS